MRHLHKERLIAVISHVVLVVSVVGAAATLMFAAPPALAAQDHGREPAHVNANSGGDDHQIPHDAPATDGALDQHNEDQTAHNGEHHDVAAERASAIAVSEPPSWYPWVVGGAAALFLLAATLGSLALIAKGPEPPDPADAHHHHGTDNHEHGHGHAH